MNAGDDDAVLVRRVRAGDARAFEILFRRYYADLCAMAARYVGSVSEAEDIVQEGCWPSGGSAAHGRRSVARARTCTAPRSIAR
jgi:hypothetical protein